MSMATAGRKSEFNEYGHSGRVLAPQSLVDTGMLPLTSATSWTSSLGKWLANTRHPKTFAFQKPKPCSEEACTRTGPHSCSEMGGSSSRLLERLRWSPPLRAETFLLRQAPKGRNQKANR